MIIQLLNQGHTLVSILVLVDAALRHCLNGHVEKIARSFNPCFSGCRPATRLSLARGVRSCRVSILVLVDAALRHVWSV